MLPPPKSFVSRNCICGVYEVRAWRYTRETAWHVKVRFKGHNLLENIYVVANGEFDSEMATFEEKTIILSLIAQWEATLRETAADPGDVKNVLLKSTDQRHGKGSRSEP
jgi:hypothetical protein